VSGRGTRDDRSATSVHILPSPAFLLLAEHGFLFIVRHFCPSFLGLSKGFQKLGAGFQGLHSQCAHVTLPVSVGGLGSLIWSIGITAISSAALSAST
jgi:hypothetical protein